MSHGVKYLFFSPDKYNSQNRNYNCETAGGDASDKSVNSTATYTKEAREGKQMEIGQKI